ncbi:MAG: polysaccharide biosynthesis/export family protein [Fidelibacterota bacterium]
MKKPVNLFIGILLASLTLSWAQTSARFRPFGEEETEFKEPVIEEVKPEEILEIIPIERPIDPDSYILGPGDIVGINIIATESLTFSVKVNPAGDILIPTVGIITVAGMAVSEAAEVIREYVQGRAYRNSVVDVTLARLRRFQILVVGAVQEPGFVEATPVDRLTAVVEAAGGLHRYADEEHIEVFRHGGDRTETVSLKRFLMNGDIPQNPTFQEDDRIEVPFLPGYSQEAGEFITYNKNAVFVTGFVKYPGAFRYFPGYSISDYIGMAGGVLDTGSGSKVDVFRSSKKIDIGLITMPGRGIPYTSPKTFRVDFLGTPVLLRPCPPWCLPFI